LGGKRILKLKLDVSIHRIYQQLKLTHVHTLKHKVQHLEAHTEIVSWTLPMVQWTAQSRIWSTYWN